MVQFAKYVKMLEVGRNFSHLKTSSYFRPTENLKRLRDFILTDLEKTKTKKYLGQCGPSSSGHIFSGKKLIKFLPIFLAMRHLSMGHPVCIFVRHFSGVSRNLKSVR